MRKKRNGALIGAGLSAVTKGEKIDIPAGALLEFKLTVPLGL